MMGRSMSANATKVVGMNLGKSGYAPVGNGNEMEGSVAPGQIGVSATQRRPVASFRLLMCSSIFARPPLRAPFTPCHSCRALSSSSSSSSSTPPTPAEARIRCRCRSRPASYPLSTMPIFRRPGMHSCCCSEAHDLTLHPVPVLPGRAREVAVTPSSSSSRRRATWRRSVLSTSGRTARPDSRGMEVCMPASGRMQEPGVRK